MGFKSRFLNCLTGLQSNLQCFILLAKDLSHAHSKCGEAGSHRQWMPASDSLQELSQRDIHHSKRTRLSGRLLFARDAFPARLLSSCILCNTKVWLLHQSDLEHSIKTMRAFHTVWYTPRCWNILSFYRIIIL